MKWTTWIIVLSLSVFVAAAPAIAKGGHGGRHGRGHEMKHLFRFGHHSHHVVEGIILGTIVGSIIVNTLPERELDIRAPSATHKTFHLDTNGECFLVNQNATGDHVLTKVPIQNCN